MKYIILIAALSFFCISDAFCTQSDTEDVSESDIHETIWSKINDWSDVIPFVGQLVAYKTASAYFGCSRGFRLDDSFILYGYIEEGLIEWRTGETGYQLAQCLNNNDFPSANALIDSTIEKASLYIRLVTVSEKARIVSAYQAGKVYFDYLDELDFN